MSANRTDLDEETKRHRGPLRGMFAVVLFALVMLGFLAFWAFGRGEPGDGAAQAEQGGATGEASDAITANDRAEEEAGSASANAEADPSAVTVPSQSVTHPQTGQTEVVNPVTGDSEAAQPLNPVDEDGAASEGGAAADSATE